MNTKNPQYSLKSLVLPSLVGFLTFGGLSSAHLMAEDTQQTAPKAAAESATITTPDGASIQIQPDGTKIIKAPDNTTIQVKPDGTKIIKEADGTTVQKNPDGSKVIQKPDGTTVQIRADGSKLIKSPDGTTVDVKAGH